MTRGIRVNSGLTLMELLVTLVLSVLVLGMVLPLLGELTRPMNRLEIPASPPWRQALQADLREMVSPDKCSVPVLQVIPASEIVPYPEIILQTFCRAGDATGGAASRGPSEVRYRVELDPASGNKVLSRYAKGWHDAATSRHVLAEHLSGWNVELDGMSPAAATQPDATIPALSLGGVMRIPVTSGTDVSNAILWVPRFAPASPPATQPADKDALAGPPADTGTEGTP